MLSTLKIYLIVDYEARKSGEKMCSSDCVVVVRALVYT